MSIINIHAQEKGKIFAHYWNNCIGAGRAAEGLRADWQQQLKEAVADCGFRYVRFHGLLSDDMGIYHCENGERIFNFRYVDSLFDALLERKIRPFIEFGFMPEALASGNATQFWWKGNITPPNDYDAWAELITNMVKHWLERYGEKEVRQWYFEVWNEPNLSVFWSGTKSQYFHLYEVTVKAIKSIDEKLRVGGPATSNFVPDDRFEGEREDLTKHKTHLVENLETLSWKGVWLEAFLGFCAEKNLPLDFLSAHPYPTDFALDGQDVLETSGELRGRSRYVGSVKDDLCWIRELVKKSKYPEIEIHLTEWSSSPTSRDYSHDYLPAATYVVKSNLECIGLVDSLSYWVFTDIFEELGPGPEAFHGGFGLMNMHGIKKPTYHAYEFLNHLGNRLICQGDGYVATKDEKENLRCLFYHYPEEMYQSVPIAEYPNHERAEEIQNMGRDFIKKIRLTGLKKDSEVILRTLDVNHGNVTTLWKEMGYPKNLTRKQYETLADYSENLLEEKIQADERGQLEISLEMSPWSITFLMAEIE